ncbi:hypothetical protein ACFXPA_48595 [Amycolatopsis sp. NPDC059090]|uniref:hypothetical protein n=1 Tax=unclassified Amycolatopsis TaxID=2618356 RepID=UPI00366B184E
MSVDWGSLGGDAGKGLADAVAALEAERRKLGELGRVREEASSAVARLWLESVVPLR